MISWQRRLTHCNNCGQLMLLAGVLVAVPLGTLLFFPEDIRYARSFLIPALGSIVMGGLVCWGGPSDDRAVERRTSLQRGSLIVLFAWGWGILAGAVPFVLSGALPPLRALFEAVSGWTTTGLSVMEVTQTPPIFLFHRSFMQFCGGLGFVMMMVMLVHGKQAMNLYHAEGHPDQLRPNLKKTARTVLLMYNGLLLAGTLAYRIAGMDGFDSVCHAMCALSTGGFSTQLNSIGEYGSLSFELITIVLMLTGATNFAVLLLLAQRKWRQFIRVSEVRFMALLLLLLIPPHRAFSIRGPGLNCRRGLASRLL